MATKPAKKSAKTTKSNTSKAKKCDCANCKCSPMYSQASFYVLIAILVATMTVLIISLSFNKSVRDIFRPSSYAYNGRFDTEQNGATKDENEFAVLSAGAVIDMINSGKTGFLVVSDESSIDSDAFARRVKQYAGEDAKVYRYNVLTDKTDDDDRAVALLDCHTAPAFIYIKNGVIYDRLDDEKDEDDLIFFLQKYTNNTEE